MNNPTDFGDGRGAEQPPVLPPEQPLWAKIIAWATIAAGSAYMINPTAGIFELLPDNLPVVGNLDEAAVVFIMFAAMRYLGLRLPEFIEKWARVPQLSSGDRDQD
jgi:uncharacterized membrane protein YkvA (DUF1232 family)